MTFRFRRLSGIVMGCLLLPIFGAAALPVQQNSGTVSGRVLSKDGMPASGLRVAAMLTTSVANGATDGALMSLTQTDSDGRYRLENISPGNYYIVAGPLDAPIYLPGVLAQSNATVLRITAGGVLEGRDFRLDTALAVKISGRVIREGHQAGSQLTLIRNGGNYSANIAPDGSFEFPAVRPGIYQVRVGPGVQLPERNILADGDITNLEIPIPLSAVDIAITVNVTLDGGGVLPRLQLQLMPSGPIPSGVSPLPPNFLTNGRMIPVNGAKASLTVPTQAFPQMEYRVRVYPSGAYGLPEGYVVRSMTAGGVDLLSQPIKISAVKPAEINISLGVVAQPPWVRVQGQIAGIDAAHAAPSNIEIRSPSSGNANVPVRPDGTFEIPAVLPGTYQVFLMPARDEFSRTIVIPREDPTRVEIALQLPSFKVAGRTPDRAQPNQRLQAMLWPEPSGTGNRPVSIPIAADGSFSFPAVQPGTYRAAVSKCESDVCTSMGGMAITVDKDILGISISWGDFQPLPIGNQSQTTLVATNAVGGTVVMENDAVMPRFRLKVAINSVTRSISVDQKAFTVTLPNGDHRLAIADLPEGFEVRSIVDGTSDLKFWPLSVGPAAAGSVVSSVPQRIRIVLGVASPAPWVKVNGRVTGVPAGTVTTVELKGALLAETLKAPVASDGSFAFPTVLPDSYELRLLPGNSAGRTITVSAAGLEGLHIDAALQR